MVGHDQLAAYLCAEGGEGCGRRSEHLHAGRVGHDQLAAYVEERRGERRHALNVVDTVPRPCRDPKCVARLMREAIRGHQWSSVHVGTQSASPACDHQRSSLVISGQQGSSAVKSGHQSTSVAVMRHHGHQGSSGVISGHEWSLFISGRHASSRSSEVIRGHQRPQWTSRGNLMQAHASSCNLVQSHACDSTTQRRTCPSVSSGRSVGSFDCTYARPSLERVGRR